MKEFNFPVRDFIFNAMIHLGLSGNKELYNKFRDLVAKNPHYRNITFKKRLLEEGFNQELILKERYLLDEFEKSVINTNLNHKNSFIDKFKSIYDPIIEDYISIIHIIGKKGNIDLYKLFLKYYKNKIFEVTPYKNYTLLDFAAKNNRTKFIEFIGKNKNISQKLRNLSPKALEYYLNSSDNFNKLDGCKTLFKDFGYEVDSTLYDTILPYKHLFSVFETLDECESDKTPSTSLEENLRKNKIMKRWFLYLKLYLDKFSLEPVFFLFLIKKLFRCGFKNNEILYKDVDLINYAQFYCQKKILDKLEKEFSTLQKRRLMEFPKFNKALLSYLESFGNRF